MHAQGIDAKWMWLAGTGNPEVEAPAGDVLFRREVYMGGPCTGEIWLAADDHFVLWVNGQKVGEGGGDTSSHFTLNGIVERGVNVIAVQVTNKAGRAGLLVDGEIREQTGNSAPFDSPGGWKALASAPQGEAWLKPGFNQDGWTAAAALSAHADSPWKDIPFNTDYLARFDIPQGFKLSRVADQQLLGGSLVAMTWGNRGRLIVSLERGPVVSLIDTDGDGQYDKQVVYSDAVRNCQGLCQVFDDLYVVGDGPDGTGLYRLRDANHDDQADGVENLLRYKGGMGEHGPHAVVYGPDGWLYNNMGNHAWVTATPQPNSPVGKTYEGDVLQPRFADANGHATGIPHPGGTIWRFSPDGKKWWMHTAGFRNEYEFGFNSAGDMFAFDSDMEWDVGLPWYRPIRVNHCTPGAQFGWRNGAAKWPEWYYDSLPGTVDIGRGSPTGVVFYEHNALPEKYRGAFIVCDWSMGRIIAVHLDQQGASFGGGWDTLVAGNPLNVSDIEVDRDGSILFCTGGRGTEGGVYRLSYGDGASAAKATNFAELLELPQMTSAWAREMASQVKTQLGDQAWQEQLERTLSGDNPAHIVRALTLAAQLGPRPSVDDLGKMAAYNNPAVRQFATLLLGSAAQNDGATVADTARFAADGIHNDAPFNAPSPAESDGAENAVLAALSHALEDADATVQRRACEAFVQAGLEPPLEPVLKLLDSDDRWLAYSARLALERIPMDKWKGALLKDGSPGQLMQALLALYRLDALTAEEAIAALDAAFKRIRSIAQMPEYLDKAPTRILELLVISEGPEKPLTFMQSMNVTPSRFEPSEMELLAAVDYPGVVEHLIPSLARTGDEESEDAYRKSTIRTALNLSYVNSGWTLDSESAYLDWYESTRDWDGGNSFKGYLRNIVGARIAKFSPEDRSALLSDWTKRPFASQLLLASSRPADIANFDKVMEGMVAQFEAQPDNAAFAPVLAAAFDVLGEDASGESKAVLRDLFGRFPDSREAIVRAMCKHPNPADAEFVWQSLRFGNETTLQVALGALEKMELKPTEPGKLRDVILAGLRLDDGNRRRNRGTVAINALRAWTGTGPNDRASVGEALAFYQNWYAEKYPDAPAAELPPDRVEGVAFTFEQLSNYLDSEGATGDIGAGKELFTKANCAKCHRFASGGDGVGPDLTGLRRRFQRKEIVESLYYPSAVISDQYKSVVVETTSGLVHTGMPVPDPTTDDLVLLLSDATKIRIKKSEIEVQVPATISVMPEGLLKELTLKQVADLFAYLETSKDHELPGGSGAK